MDFCDPLTTLIEIRNFRVCLTRHLPPLTFLRPSMACSLDVLPTLFHVGAVYGFQRKMTFEESTFEACCNTATSPADISLEFTRGGVHISVRLSFPSSMLIARTFTKTLRRAPREEDPCDIEPSPTALVTSDRSCERTPFGRNSPEHRCPLSFRWFASPRTIKDHIRFSRPLSVTNHRPE